ncbi:peroxiredoxin [Geodermatophilus sp. DSM 45219]|uniref:peroxiredoxin n=1 Tax=Geodermatophilus sp. DSM 45219 TaxID=1881103 RepID=UPI0008923B9F|nr:peroxiredoxin [Geodermatophilus sp. DSM 45219]SDO23088.1 Peroxiredoxin [Geodermatophilus sp. DSM 45219]
MSHDPTALPAHLPTPVDDGATDHLPGSVLPPLTLPATTGGVVDLRRLSTDRRLVVFAYPRTGRPGVDPPAGWDEIPGARGCTPQACAFRDLAAQFETLGVQVFGLSTQDPDYQHEVATRLHLPYSLLSDAELRLTRALNLPTFEVDGMRLLRRLTMIIRSGVIERALYPVFPPDEAAVQALSAVQALPR